MNVIRFKRAIEIIEATPDEQVRLKVWQQSFDNWAGYITTMAQATCGTIACAAGWLALDPEMQDDGLSSGYCGQPVFQEGDKFYKRFDALQRFFDIRDVEAGFLFNSRTFYERYDEAHAQLTDKQIWLNRAKHLLSTLEEE